MSHLWREILPIDPYYVVASGILHDYDRKIITLLYQPLIGSIPFSLYMTLWAQVEENRLWSNDSTHHQLMSFMGLSLKNIYEARLKLEGIGLLKTMVKNEEEKRTFIYELQSPLSPEQFFLDGMLNVYLYQKVGRNQFLRLKRFFSDHSVELTDAYKDITKPFHEVYESVSPSLVKYPLDKKDDFQLDSGEKYIGRSVQGSLQVEAPAFDFDLFFAGLSESLVPKNAINEKVKAAIQNLSYLYGIDPIAMKNLLLQAFDEGENEVNIEELRKACRDWYQFEHNEELPELVDKIQPLLFQEEIREPKTKEEKLIHYLDTTSPRQLLIDISGGAEPSAGDLKTIEDIMFNQKLLPGVINVLIQYVLLKTDMKLTKAYMEKIASHWARKKIKTVKDAMELAKKEHRQYLEWAENKKATAQQSPRKRAIRTEALPDWFFEDEKSDGNQENQGNLKAIEAKRKEVEEKLKKYKNMRR